MTISNLAARECVPCKGGIPPLRGAQLDGLYGALGAGWRLVDEHHLEKDLAFRDYLRAADFTREVAELSQRNRHHPDITLSYDNLKLVVYTHKIHGLHENDFILAAKIDEKIEEYREHLKS